MMAGGEKARKAGSSAEKAVREWFESQGYEVIVAPKGANIRGKFVPSKDFFGLFDLICVGNGCVRFVQVKSGVACKQRKNLEEWKAKAQEWMVKHNLHLGSDIYALLALKYPLRDEPDLEAVL